MAGIIGTLTGRSRHRLQELAHHPALLVLQVEVQAPTGFTWRDAKVEDLSISNTLPSLTLPTDK